VIANVKGMLFVMDSEPKGAVKRRLEELDAANKCVSCEIQCSPGSEAPDGRCKGLCLRKRGCYHKYDAQRRSMNEEQRAAYDAKLQKAGKLLEPDPGRKPDDSEFAAIAEEVKS